MRVRPLRCDPWPDLPDEKADAIDVGGSGHQTKEQDRAPVTRRIGWAWLKVFDIRRVGDDRDACRWYVAVDARLVRGAAGVDTISCQEGAPLFPPELPPVERTVDPAAKAGIATCHLSGEVVGDLVRVQDDRGR